MLTDDEILAIEKITDGHKSDIDKKDMFPCEIEREIYAFGVYARTTIPSLLSGVKELKAEIERLRAALVEAGVNIESGWYTMALDGIDNALKGSDK